MFASKELFNRIFKEDKSQKEYIIFNHSDKTWVMPTDSLRMAFDMYQPSTFKGKMLKKLIIIFSSNSKILYKLGCIKTRLQMDNRVQEYIENAVDKKNISIAAYMGDTTTKQNNKSTLQVYDKEGLICYAKVTEEKEVKKIFSHEIETLRFLNNLGVDNIPKVFGECEIDGMSIFVQSTTKLPGEKVRIKFGQRQIEFIKSITEKTKKELNYQETDYYRYVHYLKENLKDFNDKGQNILEKAITYIEQILGEKEHGYAFFHGDFTPWNVYYTDNQLYAFDFEYCYHSMPEYMDIFHYLTQMSFLGYNNGTGATVHLYKKYRKLIGAYVKDPDWTYMCYLVWIISFYHKRTKGKISHVADKVEYWISLLEYMYIVCLKDMIYCK